MVWLTPLEASCEVSVGGAIDTVRMWLRAHVGVALKESVELPPSSSLDDALFVFWSPEPPSLPSSVYCITHPMGFTLSGNLRHISESLSLSVSRCDEGLQLRGAASGSGRLKPLAREVVDWRHEIMHHEDTSVFFLNLTGILGDRRCQMVGILLLFGTTTPCCLVVSEPPLAKRLRFVFV